VQYSDFIFAVAGEELGFIGATVLILFEVVLIWQALAVAGVSQSLSAQIGKIARALPIDTTQMAS